MRFWAGLIITVLLGAATMAQVSHFPEGSPSDIDRSNEFQAKRYSVKLEALEEPSLWEASKTQKKQSYRFLWLRTFDHPIAIRLDVNAGGTSFLTAKMTSGAGGYDPGKLIENETLTIPNERTNWFLGQIEKHNFWKLPSVDETRIGFDGAQWFIEGIKDGSYHSVDRWSPKNGDVRALGLMMLNDLAKLKLSAKPMY